MDEAHFDDSVLVGLHVEEILDAVSYRKGGNLNQLISLACTVKTPVLVDQMVYIWISNESHRHILQPSMFPKRGLDFAYILHTLHLLSYAITR